MNIIESLLAIISCSDFIIKVKLPESTFPISLSISTSSLVIVMRSLPPRMSVDLPEPVI